MATSKQKPKRNRTFPKQYDTTPIPSKQDKHSAFNSDQVLTLRTNANTVVPPYRYPLSNTTTPTPYSTTTSNVNTPGTTIFRISVQDFRNKKNKRPKLIGSQTDNIRNTTAALPRHHHSFSTATHRPQQRLDHLSDIDTDDQITETEDESESVVLTDAYTNYQKNTTQFPDTVPVRNQTMSSNSYSYSMSSNWMEKLEKMERKMKKLEEELATKNKKIDTLANKLNNNMSVCNEYSDDEDGDITDEGMTDEDDDDDDDEVIENNKKKTTKHPETDSGWIIKKRGMYGSNKNSEVIEIKMSELFEQTAEKFLTFLKQDEKQKELESKHKEKIMLDLYEKVKENDRLKAENEELRKKNEKWEEEVLTLRAMKDSLNEEISNLQQQLKSAKITISEQKESIHNFRVAQFDNIHSRSLPHDHEPDTSDVHKRSATENVSIDINGVLSAIDNDTNNNNGNIHSNNSNDNTLSIPKFMRAHSVGPDAPVQLKEHEIELYELLKSFIETHKEQSSSQLQLPTYNNYSSASTAYTEDDDIKEIQQENEEEDREQRIYDENDVISFDNLDLSENSNQSIPTMQLIHDISDNDDVDLTVNDDENEYKLKNMDKDELNDIDTSSGPNMNRLKSMTYWNKRVDHIQATRHRLTTSRQNIESGIVYRLKRQFDPSDHFDVNKVSLAISNLPDLSNQPEELIRDLSNKTNVTITSTHRRKTTKAKHKHKKKPKNAKRHNTLDNDDKASLKRPKMKKDTSWRETVNQQNNARVNNLARSTPRNSGIYIDGKINIEKKSLSKITELLKVKYNGDKKQ